MGFIHFLSRCLAIANALFLVLKQVRIVVSHSISTIKVHFHEINDTDLNETVSKMIIFPVKFNKLCFTLTINTSAIQKKTNGIRHRNNKVQKF